MAKKITPDYVTGYIKAILDIYKIFEHYERAFGDRKVVARRSSKFIRALLDGIIANRTGIIQHGIDSYDIALMKSGKVKFRKKEQK